MCLSDELFDANQFNDYDNTKIMRNHDHGYMDIANKSNLHFFAFHFLVVKQNCHL